MASNASRIRIGAFPQGWDGAALALRVLVAPSGNPLQPLGPNLLPFAQGRLVLSAHFIRGLDALPSPADVAGSAILADAETPDTIEAVYQKLSDVFGVDPLAPEAYVAPTKTRFLKMLMPTYLKASGFSGSRTPFAVTDNRYVCALVDGPPPAPRPPTSAAPPKWDKVLAQALRQPILAEQLGLIYQSSVVPPAADFYEEGGWVYVTLDATSDYASAAAAGDFLALYGARIPPLAPGNPVSTFAAVLFPVSSSPVAASYDEVLAEAETYNDGFARLVHAFQPKRSDYLNKARQNRGGLRPYEESGLKLGWDDEQIVVWLNRQMTDDPRSGSSFARDTPLGIRGFRVDVRDADGAGGWNSLVHMQGTVRIGDLAVGVLDDDMAIELAPSQLQGHRDGEYWLPPYFTQWTGGSLIAADDIAFKVANQTPAPRMLRPAGERAVPLRYGRQYQFRVRLTDLTGGGPRADLDYEPTNGLATHRFRRFAPPGSLDVNEPEEQEDGSLTIAIGRPRLGYPALVYTPLQNAQALLLADAAQASEDGRLASYPDPDVARIRIDAAVASIEFDPKNMAAPTPQRLLFSTFRSFDNDPESRFTLEIQFEDVDDLVDLPDQATADALVLPTGRTVELTFTAIARRDPGMSASLPDPLTAATIDLDSLDDDVPGLIYFGTHGARLGTRRTITLRRESFVEGTMFKEIQGVGFQGLFLQPTPVNDVHLLASNAAAGTPHRAPEGALQRLARQLRIESRDLTLTAEAGRRVVFGASAGLRHLLSPDHSTITFADESQITSQWLVAVALQLLRDWTWDGVTDEGFSVLRSVNGAPRELIGHVSPTRTLNEAVIRTGLPLNRSTTDLFFFDTIDPKPAPGRFPREIDVTYTVEPRLRAVPAAPPPIWTASLHLPIAARPAQVPRIVSAGIALSPYERDAAYSRSEPRRQQLWVEFEEPVANPRDAYFARVTAYAADSMLTRLNPQPPPNPLEPPLDIDPEPIRSIRPGQTPDSSGIGAMQRLEPAGGAAPTRHFLLPLPKTLSDSSPELFGFFVYEFCVGHAEGWSTAQARYGLCQRVTGVQHPAPTLTCSLARTHDYIHVSAPHALPVADGRALQPEVPASELWALLYVQVKMADGGDVRNVLIGRTKLRLEQPRRGQPASAAAHASGYWDQAEIDRWLTSLALPQGLPLSAVAVELLPEPQSPFADPLGKDLGEVRVLRVSPLTPVPAICLDA